MASVISATCNVQSVAVRSAASPARRSAAQAFGRLPGLQLSSGLAQRQFMGVSRQQVSPSAQVQALPMEVAQVAGMATEITSTATVMFAITLVGLALGFVLLRFESLVEEGKLDNLLK